MAMKPADVIELVHDRLYPLWETERRRLDRIDRWYRWNQENVKVPHGATPEMRALVELSKTPWLGLVVSTVAQTLYVDGYRSPDAAANVETGWSAWNRNDLDSRQVPIHRGALSYGYAFATGLPGEIRGERAAVLRGVSPRKMQAVYGDPAEDDWPLFAIRVEQQGEQSLIRVYDDVDEHFLSADSMGNNVKYIERRTHGVGVTPVVRYSNMLDLDGRADGEVEPYIPVAARINKTAFDRLMTQHFNSWKVRTVAGMVKPADQDEADKAKLRLRQDDMLVAEDPDTKFGTLPETPLDGFIRAHESDVETLAAVTQTPTHALTGQMVNLSAEALAAARAQLSQKAMERQRSFGKSHDQLLRLAAHIEGDEAAAGDFESHVTWQDMEIRSFSQAADALGKIAQMLGVPVQALWSRIPGVTKLDVDEWKQMAEETGLLGELNAMLQETPNAQPRSQPDNEAA